MIWLIGAVVLACLSGAVGFAVTQATAESRYVAQKAYDADQVKHAAEMNEVKLLIAQQAKITNNLMLTLQTHLALDDPRYRSQPVPSADFVPRGD